MADPIATFLTGISSSFARTCIGVGVMLFSELLCYACSEASLAFPNPLFGLAMVVLMPVSWLADGGWAFVGLISLIGMLGSLWAFMRDHAPKTWLFALFSFALVYFSPVISGDHAWLRVVLAYGACASVYWLGPWAWMRLAGRGQE